MPDKRFVCLLLVALEVCLVPRCFSADRDPVPPHNDPVFIKKLLEAHNWLRSRAHPPASNMLDMVMWADTYKVGCAARRCKGIEGYEGGSGVIFLCHYGPKGNIPGKRPYLKGEACSKCPDEECVENLCRNEDRAKEIAGEEWLPFSSSAFSFHLYCTTSAVFGQLLAIEFWN
ncbi:cysteine-rich secretory protein LCCL domain-containing 2 isoform X2 [Microcaecilia unicolor]|uniref:Cysteine-rich secretory protein LCCL domain-containing 2-like isoform X2 n=1 Tax=Microcaecilia unicolor TaxID=1415580 RepID=A0A6P7Z0T2_9AMPH|nr:cysteine-rich secretory protein LCCL domain-containing 2-like isoform X2 [Microcaecilia unicolor]